ncbi:MAG: 30S ribosome-binding factor RbfA [Alphaproteobacteria bacterium]|nr:30S ribosome-binding factor RbfA [Alphaproteobacteria bacterium]
MNMRHLQIGESMKRALAGLQGEGFFEGIVVGGRMFSINEVRPSRGYEHAVVFVSTLVESHVNEVVAALNVAAKTIRYELANKMKMRSTPELRFKADTSQATAARIEKLLYEEVGEEDV